MLTLGVDEEYDEWDAKEKVLKLCNYFMFVLFWHKNYKPLVDCGFKMTALQKSFFFFFLQKAAKKATVSFYQLL